MTKKISYQTFPREGEPEPSPWYRFFRLLHHFEKFVKRKSPHIVSWLDIGCHSGSFLRATTSLFEIDEVVGCDVYCEEEKNGKKFECFQRTFNENWKYIQHDVSNGIVFPRKFEVISALEVIEHLIDTDQFIIDVYNALDDSGIFLITTPNINNIRNRIAVPFGRYPVGLEYRNIIHHVRLYNVDTLINQLSEHGFTILSVAGIQMLPEKIITKFGLLRFVSEVLSDLIPTLAPNILVIAEKKIKQ